MAVTGGGKSVVTDVNGIYILTDVQLDQARAYITALKQGFSKGHASSSP
ncbi:hypothetical protein [Paraflavitalea speifideaquila]|nr:hypothetical protein [Paraflavitalea speifideiaquila]